MANPDQRLVGTLAFCCVLFTAIGKAPSAHAAESVFYEGVSSDAVRCVSENIDAYRQTGRPIIVIKPDTCPETDILAGSEQGLVNMLPGKSFYRETGKEPAARGSPSVVYTQKQLVCLAALVAEGPLSALPKNPCSDK